MIATKWEKRCKITRNGEDTQMGISYYRVTTSSVVNRMHDFFIIMLKQTGKSRIKKPISKISLMEKMKHWCCLKTQYIPLS
jgi:hypothetical protein